MIEDDWASSWTVFSTCVLLEFYSFAHFANGRLWEMRDTNIPDGLMGPGRVWWNGWFKWWIECTSHVDGWLKRNWVSKGQRFLVQRCRMLTTLSVMRCISSHRTRKYESSFYLVSTSSFFDFISSREGCHCCCGSLLLLCSNYRLSVVLLGGLHVKSLIQSTVSMSVVQLCKVPIVESSSLIDASAGGGAALAYSTIIGRLSTG